MNKKVYFVSLPILVSACFPVGDNEELPKASKSQIFHAAKNCGLINIDVVDVKGELVLKIQDSEKDVEIKRRCVDNRLAKQGVSVSISWNAR
jgi:hypothetical protein